MSFRYMTKPIQYCKVKKKKNLPRRFLQTLHPRGLPQECHLPGVSSERMLSRFSRVRLSATPWTIVRQGLCPWDSLGKNTEVGCHFLVQAVNTGLHVLSQRPLGISIPELFSLLD